MKKIKVIISALVLCSVIFSASAQREQNSLRDVEERNAYGDNWFISVGGSANILHAEQDKNYSFEKRLKYGGALSIGKWFSPNFGARIQGNYGGLKGANSVAHFAPGYYTPNHINEPMNVNKLKYTDDKKTDFWQEFNYFSTSLDIMTNLTTLSRGYYRERGLIDVIPFVGLGWIHSFDNGSTNPDFNHFVAKVGLRLNINLTKSFAVYLEPQANFTERELDGYAGTALGDGFSNWGIGLQYTFNKRFDNIVKMTADEVDRLNNKINANRYLIENQQDILERQQGLIDRLQKCCDEPKQVITQMVGTSYLPDYVRFGLDSYKLEQSELRKLAELSDYLKKNPDSKVLLVGYADRQTGNPRYNLGLSQKRVEATANELKRLGVSESRMSIDWKGDKEQPFPQNEWNRVVVIVERK